jgi:putative ABC transport system permease protein
LRYEDRDRSHSYRHDRRSEAGAKKYFGMADPMGQSLLLDGKYNFRITGIMKNIPENAHFHGDILLSMSTFSGRLYGNWD